MEFRNIKRMYLFNSALRKLNKKHNLTYAQFNILFTLQTLDAEYNYISIQKVKKILAYHNNGNTTSALHASASMLVTNGALAKMEGHQKYKILIYGLFILKEFERILRMQKIIIPK